MIWLRILYIKARTRDIYLLGIIINSYNTVFNLYFLYIQSNNYTSFNINWVQYSINVYVSLTKTCYTFLNLSPLVLVHLVSLQYHLFLGKQVLVFLTHYIYLLIRPKRKKSKNTNIFLKYNLSLLNTTTTTTKLLLLSIKNSYPIFHLLFYVDNRKIKYLQSVFDYLTWS